MILFRTLITELILILLFGLLTSVFSHEYENEKLSNIFTILTIITLSIFMLTAAIGMRL